MKKTPWMFKNPEKWLVICVIVGLILDFISAFSRSYIWGMEAESRWLEATTFVIAVGILFGLSEWVKED